MKKLLSVLLALAMVLSIIPFALAEDFEEEETDAGEEIALSPLEIALNYRPVSDEPVHITVGNTTKVKGSFFTSYFGNNTSDIDVRTMLHGYSPVVWDNQLQFIADPMVAESITRTDDTDGVTYTVTLAQDLLYNDGVTPLTAQDYVFAWLLSCSPQLADIGAEAPKVDLLGYDAFRSGESQELAGVRLLGDYAFSVTFASGYETYFYDYSRIAVNPCPISVLAPGCAVRDEGAGAYLEGNFTADLLRETILDPKTGYASHPSLTCGPYSLVSYDAESGIVDFALNPYYKGNYEGVKPVIDTVTLVPVEAETMIRQLENGEVDALNKCVDQSVILAGLQLAAGEGFAMTNYARLGYGFCAFSCEQGPQQFQAVRQALNYAFDSEAFIDTVLGGFGLPVYGYYGLGQWMYVAAAGSLHPEDLPEAEEAAWDALSLDSLNPYPLDLEEANRLLDEDGWVLNEQGQPYDAERDALRCKMVDGELMPLSLRFARSKGNPAAYALVAMYEETLPQIGARFEVEDVEFNELLADYYRDDGVRRFDMNFMATNFVSAFDPYLVFLGRDDMQGAVNTSGLVDEELIRLAFEMRSTEPGDLLTFEQRWLAMQQRYNEILPTMPIYGNIYFDFHTDRLQNYYPNAEYSWPVALLYAFFGDPALPAAAAAESSNDVSSTEDELLITDSSLLTDSIPAAADIAPELTTDTASSAEDPILITDSSLPTDSVPADTTSDLSAIASQLSIESAVTMPPKDGVAYRPGEVISFLITVINHSGESLQKLTISESASGKSAFHSNFLHGEKIPFLVGYTVTEEDAQQGAIRSEVTVTAETRSGEAIAAVSSGLDLPAGK